VKTTVEVPDALFRQAKKYCAENGVPFRAVVEQGLRHVIEGSTVKRRFRLKEFGFRGEGLAGPSDWSQIREIIYEGRGGRGESSEGG